MWLTSQPLLHEEDHKVTLLHSFRPRKDTSFSLEFMLQFEDILFCNLKQYHRNLGNCSPNEELDKLHIVLSGDGTPVPASE